MENLSEYDLKHSKRLLNVEMSNEAFDFLMCEQSKGKELKVIDGNVVAIEHIFTEEELKQQALYEKTTRLTELTKDFVQIQAGLIIENIEERYAEFRTLLNEVRVLQGKEPRNFQ